MTPPRSNTLGLVAMIMAIVGLVLTFIPIISVLGWILMVVSFILGIVAVAQKGTKKGMGIAAILISVIGGVISLMITILWAALLFFPEAGDVTISGGSSDSATSSPSTGSEASSGGQTSRDNPAPLGSVITTEKWEIIINSVDLNATEKITSENEWADKPEAGETYIIVNMTVKYLGDDREGAHPWIGVSYVAPDGKSYESYDKYLPVPEAFDSSSKLFSGASATGNLALAVKTPDVDKGVLAIVPDILEDTVFVAVK